MSDNREVIAFFLCQNKENQEVKDMGMIYNPNTCRYEYIPDYYQPQTQNQTKSPTQNQQGLLWVSGEVGAKSWIVPPSSTVLLMDSESNRFYIKSSDTAGMPTIKTYEYKEIAKNEEPQINTQNVDNNGLINEIENIKQEISEVKAKLEQITEKKETKKPAKKEVTENE